MGSQYFSQSAAFVHAQGVCGACPEAFAADQCVWLGRVCLEEVVGGGLLVCFFVVVFFCCLKVPTIMALFPGVGGVVVVSACPAGKEMGVLWLSQLVSSSAGSRASASSPCKTEKEKFTAPL